MIEPAKPYHTGTYLIFDNDPERPAKDGNFRSGRSLDPPLRASGSHQLDAGMLASVIDRIANDNPEVRRVVIVDLRQESHAFLNDRAVSWCADRDWSNVGHSPHGSREMSNVSSRSWRTLLRPTSLRYGRVPKERSRSSASRHCASHGPRPRRWLWRGFRAGSSFRTAGFT